MRRPHGVQGAVLGPFAFLATSLVACGDGASPPGTAVDPDTLLAPGQAHYWQGAYDSAQVIWGASLERAQADGDSVSSALLMTWLGLAAMRSGDFALARSQGEAALALKLALGLEEEVTRSYNALGLLALAEDRLVDALRLFELTRTAALAVDDEMAAGAAAGNLGLIHAYLGDLTLAAELLRQMQAAGVTLGEKRLEANALTNLAMVSIWSGDPHGALPSLEEARRIYREIDYPLGEQYALGQLASALAEMGRYQDAFTALDSALVLADRHGMPDLEAETHGLLGALFADLGDPRRALRHFEEAATLAGELGMDAELGNVLRRAAIAHFNLGSEDRALADAEAALAAHRAAGQSFEELDGLLVLADLQQRTGDPIEARTTLLSARIVAHQLDTRSALTLVALAEARLAESAGEPREALAAAQRAREISLEADFRARTEIHSLAARAHAALGEFEPAAAEALAAVRALERVRDGIASEDLRGSLVASTSEVYGDAVLILLQLGRQDEAFAVADAARSRELLHRLTTIGSAPGAGSGFSDPAAPADEFGAAELLLRRIDTLLSQLQLLEELPPDERGVGADLTSLEILARIDRLRDEYESLAIRTAGVDRRSADMLGAQPADPAWIQDAIASDEALLHYTLTRDRLVLFVGRTGFLETLEIPVTPQDLTSRIRLLRELWGTRDTGAERGLPAAQGLYELLLAPALEAGLLEGASRLVIVPHGVLEQLPFQALVDPSTRRFLVEDYVISYTPSASALPALRNSQSGVEGGVRSVDAFAPFPQSLPGTRAEAVAANDAVSDGRLYLDRRATEGAVRGSLADPSVVHVASHGILNARNPMFSRIDLARAGGSGSDDDGRLEVHEVLRLQINSPLVVLSGCETARAEEWSGDPLRSAGVTTLSQAFLQAGARNVMATLWRIHDLGSAELVSRFYQEASGGDVALGLAWAQRAMIADAEYAAPYYWAGFVLVGDGHISGSRHGTVAGSVR